MKWKSKTISLKADIGAAKHFRLLEALVFDADGYGEIEVPAGYRYDGASIPAIFWPIVGHPWRRYRASAALHDYLRDLATVASYQEVLADCMSVVLGDRRVTRPVQHIDYIFRQAVKAEGVGLFRRTAMWMAVRLQAWWVYGRKA